MFCINCNFQFHYNTIFSISVFFFIIIDSPGSISTGEIDSSPKLIFYSEWRLSRFQLASYSQDGEIDCLRDSNYRYTYLFATVTSNFHVDWSLPVNTLAILKEIIKKIFLSFLLYFFFTRVNKIFPVPWIFFIHSNDVLNK